MTAPAAREYENFVLHSPHINDIANAAPRKRNALLREAMPSLVQALATAVRLLNAHGHVFDKKHARRARRMMSRNTAIRTKMGLVAGFGTQSRGGGFWGEVTQSVREGIKTPPQRGRGFKSILKKVGKGALAAAGIAASAFAAHRGAAAYGAPKNDPRKHPHWDPLPQSTRGMPPSLRQYSYDLPNQVDNPYAQ